jgi:hypothetical protein
MHQDIAHESLDEPALYAMLIAGFSLDELHNLEQFLVTFNADDPNGARAKSVWRQMRGSTRFIDNASAAAFFRRLHTEIVSALSKKR